MCVCVCVLWGRPLCTLSRGLERRVAAPGALHAGCNLQDELFASFEQVLTMADKRGEPYARWDARQGRRVGQPREQHFTGGLNSEKL